MTGDLTSWASAALSEAAATLNVGSACVTLRPPSHSRASHVLDVDGKRAIGQFVVWPDGATEATILDIATEQPVYFEDDPVCGLTDLHDRFRAFLEAFREAEKATP